MKPIVVLSNSAHPIRHAIVTIFLLLFLWRSVSAQHSATDGSTPPYLTPGAPAGSYPLSGFDNINLFNGTLNFSLPLLKIGGRGAAGMPVVFKFERKWRVFELPLSTPPRFFPTPEWWVDSSSPLMYAGGILKARTAGAQFIPCITPNDAGVSLRRLTFIIPDGTEFELIDKLTGG